MNAEDIIAAGGRETGEFKINDQLTVRLRALSFNDFGPWLRGGEVVVDIGPVTKMLARSIVDEEGRRIFKDTDAKRIGEMDPQVVLDMFTRLMEISNLGDVEKVKEDFAQAQSAEPSTG